MWQYDDYGNPVWVDVANRGLDVLGAWASHSPYYSPDDPRFQGYPGGGAYPPNVPPYPPQSPGFSLGSVGLGGVQISPVTFLLGGIVLALIFFGKTRR